MPRYFFNVMGDGYMDEADEGRLLDGPREANTVATALAGALLMEADGRFWTHPDWQLTVTDQMGRTVCNITIQGSSFSATAH